MKSLINLPYTKCFVRVPHIRQASQTQGTVAGYLVAVRCVLNEAPKLIVMTDEGALFDSVPPHAICFWPQAEEKRLPDVCPWDCLADAGEIVELEFMRHWVVRIGNQIGRYMFTLHFNPNQAFGRDPVQQKMFHFVEGNDGNLHVTVNNRTKWLCDALVSREMKIVPESNERVWFAEE